MTNIKFTLISYPLILKMSLVSRKLGLSYSPLGHWMSKSKLHSYWSWIHLICFICFYIMIVKAMTYENLFLPQRKFSNLISAAWLGLSFLAKKLGSACHAFQKAWLGSACHILQKSLVQLGLLFDWKNQVTSKNKKWAVFQHFCQFFKVKSFRNQ